MSAKTIVYNGRTILSVRFQDCKTEQEMLHQLEEVADILTKSTAKKLILSDFTGSSISAAVMNRIKELGTTIYKIKIEKNAVLGVTGLKNVLFQSYISTTRSDTTRTFSTEEEAKDWLVS